MDLIGLGPLATFDRSHREKISFTGSQAHWFLDQLITNQTEGLSAGQGCEALLLTPKGRITAILNVISVGSDEVLVDTEAGHDPTLAEYFSGRIFSTQVEVENVSDDWAILRVMGESALKTVKDLLRSELPTSEHGSVKGPDGDIAVFRSRPVEGWDIWHPKDRHEVLMSALSEAGTKTVGPDEWEAIRIVGGVLSYPRDLAAGFLPQEAALESAVHFAKGCYLGQEAVAMAQRGRVPRRFRHLHFTAEATKGEVLYEGKAVGVITSWADWQGRGFGLAPLSSSVPASAVVEVRGTYQTEAEVHPMPGEVTGPRVPSARELRERLVRDSPGQ